MSHGYSGRQPAYTARCRNVSHTSRCMNSIQFSSSSLCFRSAIFLRQINLYKGTNFLDKTRLLSETFSWNHQYITWNHVLLIIIREGTKQKVLSLPSTILIILCYTFLNYLTTTFLPFWMRMPLVTATTASKLCIFSEWNSCCNCPLDELWRINDEIWGLLFEEGYMLIIWWLEWSFFAAGGLT